MNSGRIVENSFVVICGDAEFAESLVRAGALATGSYVVFRGGDDCRRYLARGAKGFLVVGPKVVDVSPLNLIAAVREDEAKHDVEGSAECKLEIILCREGSTGTPFANRARRAGADRVMGIAQAGALLKEQGPAHAPMQPAELNDPPNLGGLQAADQVNRDFIIPKGENKGEPWTFDEVLLISDDGYCRRFTRST